MCLYPKLIKNKKYTSTKKNGGVIPAINDMRVLMLPVGCGKCMECRKKKSNDWRVRLNEEIKQNKNGKFVTLTFSNDSMKLLYERLINDDKINNNKLNGYDLDNKIVTKAVRLFLERWRKKYKKSVKHWFVTELGQTNTERVHIHGIIWTDVENKIINDIWSYGYTWIGDKNTGGYVNEKTINYVVKYVTKIDKLHKEYNSIVLCSKGIGKNYVESYNATENKYKGKDTKEYYNTKSGLKIGIPIYYRNKIYSENEREKLWLQKLDENVRYVGGEKIDISKGEENYYKALEFYRAKNKRLGFGDDSKNWNLKQYENERRNLIKKISVGIITQKNEVIQPDENNKNWEKLPKIDIKDAF